MLKTLGASTKKRNTEDPTGNTLESRTKHWKDGPKSSSNSSTDPDGSKNPPLRSARPDVSEKLENLSQLLELMKLHQLARRLHFPSHYKGQGPQEACHPKGMLEATARQPQGLVEGMCQSALQIGQGAQTVCRFFRRRRSVWFMLAYKRAKVLSTSPKHVATHSRKTPTPWVLRLRKH